MKAVAGMVPPLLLFLMEDALNKTYCLKRGGRRTLAGIGFFNPFFVATDEAMVEKIEDSYWFKKGKVEIVYEEKPTVQPPITVQPPASFEVETKLSRKALFAQHGEKISSAAFLTVQRVALEVGATEEETAGLSKVKLMKLIRDRTVA